MIFILVSYTYVLSYAFSLHIFIIVLCCLGYRFYRRVTSTIITAASVGVFLRFISMGSGKQCLPLNIEQTIVGLTAWLVFVRNRYFRGIPRLAVVTLNVVILKID